MIVSRVFPQSFFQKSYYLLGVLATLGLLGYGLLYLIVMPEVSPGGFVPSSSAPAAEIPAWFGTLQALFVLIYAFAFLPVTLMFTVRRFSEHPHAVILACCLLALSLMIQITNSLPILARSIYPAPLQAVSSEVRLYLAQVESIRYLSYDVTGFTLAYIALALYAMVYPRSPRGLSLAVIASIVLFVANVLFLWIYPNAAVVLMALSILALAPVPVLLARMALE